MGESQCPHCGHVVTGFEQEAFEARKAELHRLRNIIFWCQRRLPTEGYKKLVDTFLSGDTREL